MTADREMEYGAGRVDIFVLDGIYPGTKALFFLSFLVMRYTPV